MKMIEPSKKVRPFKESVIGKFNPIDVVCIRLQLRKNKGLNWKKIGLILNEHDWKETMRHKQFCSKKGNTLAMSVRLRLQ